MPRICDTYKKYGIHQTFFVPAWCIERYPAAIEVMLEGGRVFVFADGTLEERQIQVVISSW